MAILGDLGDQEDEYERFVDTLYTMGLTQEQVDFRRGTRICSAMPNEESVILLMGETAMGKKSYLRLVSKIDLDKDLFPNE